MKREQGYKNHLQPLLKWLMGDANRHDERALDASAQGDPFLADALEGYRTLPEADHVTDVTRLKARLRQKARRRGAWFYTMRVAAVGAVLIGAWLVFQQFQETQKGATVAEIVSSPATDTAFLLSDSTELAITSQAENADIATANQVDGRRNFPSSKKTEAPITRNEYYTFDSDLEPDAAAGVAPPPVVMKLDTLALQNADAALAMEETQAAPESRKDEDLSKTRAKAQNKAPASPSASTTATNLRNITGRVTDENGVPLIATNIMVSGTNAGVITDVDGRYSIEVPMGTESLVFSYTGYSQVQVNLADQGHLDVQLSESDASLSEVVVAGYALAGGESSIIKSPRPVGGFKAYRKYVTDNLQHPEADKQPRPRQVVRIHFTLQADGSLSDFKVRSGNVPQAYKDEAVRLLTEGARWTGTTTTTASFRFVFE